MSSSKIPPSTLKGVLEAVWNGSYGDLSKARRAELRSGIDTFSRCVGRDPSELDANVTAIRAIERHAKPQINNVTKGAYATALSRVLAALEYVGVPVDRRRDMPLSSEWAALLDHLDDHQRMDLRKFAGWCSARGIKPSEVTQEIFNRFFEFLQEQSVQHNYKERWHRPRRAWNKGVASEGSGYPKIENVFENRLTHLKLKDMPPSFIEDAERYADLVTKLSVTSERIEPLSTAKAHRPRCGGTGGPLLWPSPRSVRKRQSAAAGTPDWFALVLAVCDAGPWSTSRIGRDHIAL
jgi:hypothetical protein